MYKFMFATFALLGWVFFEASGGSEFEPERRITVEATNTEALEMPGTETTTVASAPIAVEGPVEDIQVSRASAVIDPLPVSLSLFAETDEVEEVLDVVATEIDVFEPVDEAPESVGSVLTETLPELLDLREVSGSRVNMRSGPGTSFDVLDTLVQGTEAEVLDIDGTGWVRIRVLETGQIGWMAERLLARL